MTGRGLLETGRLTEARDQFWRDAEAAQRRGDAEPLGAAALGLGGIWVHEHRSTLEAARVSALQRSALARLDPGTRLARRLSVRLAAEHSYLTGDATAILAELSAARSHRTDPLVLAEALSLAHHCLLGPQYAEQRLALAEELIAVSPTTGRPLDGLMGLAWRTVDLFLAGDRGATRCLNELRERLEIDRCDALSYLVAALDTMLATRAGRLLEAERLADDCHQLGLAVGDRDADGWYGAQLVAIRWLQGRGTELLPRLRDMVSSPTVAEQRPGFVAAVAVLGATSGAVTDARTALASLRSGGLRAVPSSSIWLATMLGVCEAAHTLGDVAAAAEAYELLAPYAELPIMASLGVACYGSAHRPLGLAAWTMGRLDAAVAHLEAAIAAELAIANIPRHAVDLAALADALDKRGGPGDADRATEIRRAAIEEARRTGMSLRADRWEQLIAVPAVTCRRDGRVWQVRLGERAVAVPHSVGMGYLAHLIEHAGVEVAAVELASGYAVSCRGSSPEPVLDARAKAAYRRRIDELRDDVHDAEAHADPARAALARAELDRFVTELTRCTGFGGETRSFVDAAERARVSVQKAIKRALATITEADPKLGQELASRVITGMRCVYLASDLPGQPRRGAP